MNGPCPSVRERPGPRGSRGGVSDRQWSGCSGLTTLPSPHACAGAGMGRAGLQHDREDRIAIQGSLRPFRTHVRQARVLPGGRISMTVRFSKWPHDDSRIIVRRRDKYVGCIRKRENGWVPSLDLSTALNGADDRSSRARKGWRSELEAIREIRRMLSPATEPRSRHMKERDGPLKRVVQQDRHGSGVACVAMLAGKSYGAVAKEMFSNGAVPGTETADLRKALAVHGLELAHHSVPFRSTSYEDLKDTAILKANPRRGGAEWHWVVWDAGRRRLLDPRDPPYKRIRACSYLTVR